MAQENAVQGKIVQCIGAVVDVEFPRDRMPKIYDALQFEGGRLTLEVQQQLGDGVVRTIALGSSDGLRRGLMVTNTNAPITLRLQVVDGNQRPVRNWAEISVDSGNDEDSTPDTDTGNDNGPGTGTPPNDLFTNHNDILIDTRPDDEDDNDYEQVEIAVFDLALQKVLPSGMSAQVTPPERRS